MNYCKLFKAKLNVIKLLFFTIATSFISYGQEKTDDEVLDGLLDELFFNDKELVDDLLNAINQYDFIYTNLTYNSNTFFAGRDSGTDQLNVIPQISYFSSSGFNAAITSVYFDQQDPQWDFVGLTAGYANTLGEKKNFHYNASYSRFFYSDGWDAFNNSIDVLFGVRNNERTLGVIGTASYLFGTDQSFQFSTRLYGNFTLVRNSASALRFRPQVNFLFARQTIFYIEPPRNGVPPRLVTNEEFAMLNTQINIPLSYTTSSWDIELSWNVNLPSPIEREGDLDTTNFISLSIGYLLDLGKK